MSTRNVAITRLLSVLALAAAVAAVIVVIGSATGDGGDGGETKKAQSGKKQQAKKKRNRPKAYEVKEGDSLSIIADRTGVPVEEIEALNPDLDPQALTIGQKLKLR